MIDLNDLAKKCHTNAVDKGFYEDFEALKKSTDVWNKDFDILLKSLKVKRLMLIVSEVAEAMEADRKNLIDDKLKNRTGLEVELADTIIRILDFCGWLNFDIEGAIKEKIEFNLQREYLHGKLY